jgi:uncharacterized SAM-binding protein YcdF (DUF218 family)
LELDEMAVMTVESRAMVQARICRWVAAILAGLFLAMICILLLAGLWLQTGASVVEDADVAVVLAGSADRTLYAADLYNKGIVHRVAISRPVAEPEQIHLAERGIETTPEEEMHRRILLHLGVPDSVIDFLPGQSRNTRDEAVSLLNYLGSRDLKVIVIESPFVVRRASLIFPTRFGNSQVRVVATPYEQVDWRWWESPSSAREVVLELVKSLYLVLVKATGR